MNSGEEDRIQEGFTEVEVIYWVGGGWSQNETLSKAQSKPETFSSSNCVW